MDGPGPMLTTRKVFLLRQQDLPLPTTLSLAKEEELRQSFNLSKDQESFGFFLLRAVTNPL